MDEKERIEQEATRSARLFLDILKRYGGEMDDSYAEEDGEPRSTSEAMAFKRALAEELQQEESVRWRIGDLVGLLNYLVHQR